MQGEGTVSELVLLDGLPAARIDCSASLIPAPGQYVLAHAAGSDAPLASALFASSILPDGLIAAPPIPSTWHPGTRLRMRGPLGHGFSLPPSAHNVALIAFHCPARTLLSMLELAFRQAASVTVVGVQLPDDLPLQVEMQPLHALPDILRWADFTAFDLPRESLPELKSVLQTHRTAIQAEGQVLIRTPMPCGALAMCGVCTVELKGRVHLACDDGPVFDMRQLLE